VSKQLIKWDEGSATLLSQKKQQTETSNEKTTGSSQLPSRDQMVGVSDGTGRVGQEDEGKGTDQLGQVAKEEIMAESKFYVKPAFRRVLMLVPSVPSEQDIFTFDEVCIYL